MSQPDTLDVQLLISPRCAVCPAVIEALTRLLKEGRLSSLHIYNLMDHPEKSREFGTRSVPWMRIGEFEFTGGYRYEELKQWAEAARQPDGRRRYLIHLLEQQQIERVIALAADPAWLGEVLSISADLEAPMAARIGASAVIEHYADSEALRGQLSRLLEMSRSTDRQTRADAAYFLGLAGGEAALERLREMQEDDDREVREIASEALADAT